MVEQIKNTVWNLYEDGGWHIACFTTKKQCEEFVKKYYYSSNKIFDKHNPKGDMDYEISVNHKSDIILLNKTFNIIPEDGVQFMASIGEDKEAIEKWEIRNG